MTILDLNIIGPISEFINTSIVSIIIIVMGNRLDFGQDLMQKNIYLIIILQKVKILFLSFYSIVKRGASTKQMVEENYNDIQMKDMKTDMKKDQ